MYKKKLINVLLLSFLLACSSKPEPQIDESLNSAVSPYYGSSLSQNNTILITPDTLNNEVNYKSKIMPPQSPCNARDYYLAKWYPEKGLNQVEAPMLRARITTHNWISQRMDSGYMSEGAELSIRGKLGIDKNGAISLAVRFLQNGRFNGWDSQSAPIWQANTDPCLWLEVDASLLQLQPGFSLKPETFPNKEALIARGELPCNVIEFNIFDRYNDNIVHGHVSARYFKADENNDEGFRIEPELYDFDIKTPDTGINWWRNREAEFGRAVHGNGTPFWIIFKGRAKLWEGDPLAKKKLD